MVQYWTERSVNLLKSEYLRVGHVVKMQENRLQYQNVCNRELEQGFRYKGCPKKRFNDCIKVMSDNLGVGQNWEEIVQDRNTWNSKFGLHKSKEF